MYVIWISYTGAVTLNPTAIEVEDTIEAARFLWETLSAAGLHMISRKP